MFCQVTEQADTVLSLFSRLAVNVLPDLLRCVFTEATVILGTDVFGEHLKGSAVITDVSPGISALAHVSDEQISVRFQYVDVMGADTDKYMFFMIFRLCGVKILSFQADLSVSVSFVCFIPADIKWLYRKVQ